MCDSSLVVAKFTEVEFDLAKQLLTTLTELPGPREQPATSMRSDCCVALNSIMAATSPSSALSAGDEQDGADDSTATTSEAAMIRAAYL